jgi:hypothetical protein
LYLSLFERSLCLFDARGIQLNINPAPETAADLDIVICKRPSATYTRPTVVAHLCDSGALVVTDVLSQSNVLSYDKYSKFTPEGYKGMAENQWVRERHADLLTKPDFGSYQKTVLSLYHKIRSLVHFGMLQQVSRSEQYGQSELAKRGPSVKQRPVDIFFAGTSSLTAHRSLLMQKLAEIKNLRVDACLGKSGKPPASWNAYAKRMIQAKICVSPWGFGETCYRDFEALLSMCILIKPDTSFSEVSSEAFIPDKTVFYCKPDWSDLPEVIDKALALSTGIDRLYAHRTLVQERRLETFVDRYVTLLKSL